MISYTYIYIYIYDVKDIIKILLRYHKILCIHIRKVSYRIVLKLTLLQ